MNVQISISCLLLVRIASATWYQHNKFEYFFDSILDNYNDAVETCSEVNATLAIVKN